MKRSLIFSVILAVAFSAALAAGGRREAKGADEQPSASNSGSFGVGVVDGLHLTGTAIDVNIAEYRLGVSGLVERPLSIDFPEIRAMPSVRRRAALVCPGFFRDEGVWTGTPLRLLLERAGLREEARSVAFKSIDGSYEQTLPLDEAMSERVYLAYEFNGKLFDPRNGYPLRLVVEGEAGALWVKWLGAIEVRGE